jgi:beta-lactamase class A
MISISDNTATDHLLFHLGREAVEQVMASTGHHDPSLNMPFLSTREMFVIKLLLDQEQQQAYLTASEEEQRRQLAETIDLTSPALAYFVVGFWTAPRLIDTLEWFATPADICQTYAAILQMAETNPEVGLAMLDILAINPGIPMDSAIWPYVGYKGGSEVGVLSLNQLVRRQDGRWFAISAMFNDSTHDIDQSLAVFYMQRVHALLAEQP